MSKITGKVNYKEVLKGDTGYTFEPHVTVDGILYWSNNGNLENPLPVNLHGKQGFMFIPHVDSEGNLSWTNTGELENPPTVNIKGDKGYFYTPHISEDGILTWSNNGNLENPQPFNISDLILNEVKESRVDTTGKTFSKLKERLDSDFKKLSESIKNNDTKDEVVQARTATTGENFMTLDDRIDHEVMRLRDKIEVTMLEQEDKESHDISNTIDGMSSDMVIKGKTIKLDNGEIKSFGQEENKISILSSGKNFFKSYNSKSKGNTSIFNIENDNVTIGINQSPSWTNASINYGKLKIGSKYTVSCESFTGGVGDNVLFAIKKYRGKNEVGAYGDITKSSLSLTFTVVDDADIVLRFFVNNTTPINTPTSITYNNIQIIEGVKTDYAPSVIDKKDILLSEYGFDEGLRGLNDTVYDKLNDIENVAIKRIGKHVFTGNETIRQLENSTAALIVLLENIKGVDSKHFISNSNIGYETRWNVIEWENNYPIAFNFKDSSAGSMSLLISKSKIPSVTDIDSLKQYLRENNIELYYQLKEPIETPLNENINVKTFNDKTYVNFENSIKGASSFKVPVNTNKLINDLMFEKEDLKEKFNNLTNEFENFKTYMIQTLAYKEV